MWLSAAALLGYGCREHARLSDALESPEALARAVVEGLSAGDLNALRALAIDEAEFREIVWPRLPASRPERNLTWQYVWRDLNGKSEAHLRALAASWQARGLEVAAVGFEGDTTDYGVFRVRRKTVVTLRDPQGQERQGRLFGSTIEMGGRVKVFSYVVD